VEKIFKKILNYNDWAIDTAITFFSFSEACSIYEVYIKEGKLHKYYGSLEDLKTMCVECFAILQKLRNFPIKRNSAKYVREWKKRRVSQKVKTKVSYKIEKTLLLLKKRWNQKQLSYLRFFPEKVRNKMRECRRYPRFAFMTKKTWFEVFKILLKKFKKGDKDWEELLFKLWVARVLNYTLKIAIKGYDYALDYLEKMIEDYKDWALCKKF
jgi:mannosylglycerate synthase